MNAVALHLRECTVCAAQPFAAPTPAPRLLLAAAFLTVIAAGAWWYGRGEDAPPVSLQTLVEATSLGRTRSIEGRLSGGFPWAPHRPTSKPGPDLQLEATAMQVVQTLRGDQSSERRHAVGVAYLFVDRSMDAVTALGRTADTTADARVWNDLGAAHLQAAAETDDPARLAKALTAVDAAIRIDPKLPEAFFNRALILQHLGLRDQARAAWEGYLAVDATSPWATEARQRLASLAPEETFAAELERTYEQLADRPLLAQALARRRPQEARTWGETMILANWASAYERNDAASAEKHLRIARALGAELVRTNGDRMLASAVAAIDAADPGTRAALAAGHIAFRDGQQTYKGNRAAAAHKLFLRARTAFEQGRSPMALLARYFAANTTFDSGKPTDARREHETLLATAPAEYPAHKAQLQWQLGRTYALSGDWGRALDTLEASVAGFERLGEKMYATVVREIIAEVYDRIGDPAAAWQQRMIALGELGRNMTPRLQVLMTSLTRAAVLQGNLAEAASFLELELDMARRAGSTPGRRVEVLLQRADLRRMMGDPAGANADVAEARQVIASLNDAAISTLLEVNADAVQASLASTPRESVQLLTKALQSLGSRGRTFQNPELLLQRGRAWAAAGQDDTAAADFEAAIVALESSRESLPQGDRRLGVFDVGREVFEEAIALAVARRDHPSAFAYAERARARQLLETLGASWPVVAATDIPADTVIVEYTALPDRLVIFAHDRTGVRVVEERVSRADLDQMVARFATAVVGTNPAARRPLAAELHRRLIEPVAPHLQGRSRLVLVPDSTLSPVAFAALIDGDGRYLIERHTLVVSPSAAVFARLNGRAAPRAGTPRLLLVANPIRGSEGEPSLPAAEQEGKRISRLYRQVTKLTRADATADAFRREARTATIIHFAGHATAGRGRGTALLLSATKDDDGRVDPKTIAALPLTQTSTVILAGCSTARGETKTSEGAISVARAFLAAGVPSVVATLQPLADAEAADFFPRLHDYLARGVPPAEALRAVQIDWIRRSDVRSAAWATVQLIGS